MVNGCLVSIELWYIVLGNRHVNLLDYKKNILAGCRQSCEITKSGKVHIDVY